MTSKPVLGPRIQAHDGDHYLSPCELAGREDGQVSGVSCPFASAVPKVCADLVGAKKDFVLSFCLRPDGADRIAQGDLALGIEIIELSKP
jgi:hypothetical protein